MIIYTTKDYCVYLTSYTGNKLPQFYIGSSTIKRIIEKNYHGTVKSKKYKNVWNEELKHNPHLFKTIIISYHYTRKEALEKESKLQKALNVVDSSMYINLSTAAPNGYFGTIITGKEHRNYLPDKEQPYYIFISPFNDIIIKQGMKALCEQHNLIRNKFVRILNNPDRFHFHKGWRIFNYSEEKLQWLTDNPDWIEKTNKTYIAINKNKELYLINNTIFEFCKENAIHYNSAIGCSNGKYDQISGWRFFKYNKELYEKLKYNTDIEIKNKFKKYIGIDKNNIVYYIDNISEFCKTHNVVPRDLYACADGKYAQIKTWRFFHYSSDLYENIKKSPESFGSPIKKQSNKIFYFISPDGNLTIIDNLPKFCSDNFLSYASMLALNKGKIKSTHKGWKRYSQP